MFYAGQGTWEYVMFPHNEAVLETKPQQVVPLFLSLMFLFSLIFIVTMAERGKKKV